MDTWKRAGLIIEPTVFWVWRHNSTEATWRPPNKPSQSKQLCPNGKRWSQTVSVVVKKSLIALLPCTELAIQNCAGTFYSWAPQHASPTEVLSLGCKNHIKAGISLGGKTSNPCKCLSSLHSKLWPDRTEQSRTICLSLHTGRMGFYTVYCETHYHAHPRPLNAAGSFLKNKSQSVKASLD